MMTAKLGTCLAAAAITLASATYLATPALAVTALGTCSLTQMAYAEGHVDGSCSARGYSQGNLTSCNSNDDGSFSWSGTCSN